MVDLRGVNTFLFCDAKIATRVCCPASRPELELHRCVPNFMGVFLVVLAQSQVKQRTQLTNGVIRSCGGVSNGTFMREDLEIVAALKKPHSDATAGDKNTTKTAPHTSMVLSPKK
jgi:hypothetical protein